VSEFDPERIGEVHFTFAYPTPIAAKVAWERAAKRVRFLSIYRHALDGDINRQAITVLGEEDERCRPQLEKARRLLQSGGREIPVPDYVFAALQHKRLETLLQVALQGGGTARRQVRYGEHGAIVDPLTGGVTPRRRGQG
jgi:hypothetical protein